MATINYYTDIPLYYKDLWYSKIRYYTQPYLNTNYNISKITDNIYLSDLATACNKKKLKQEGITHILCVMLGLDPIYQEDFEYKTVPVRDVVHQDISQYLDECVEYIEDAIKVGGKVLVHCSYGVSRSVSMVIAYLIKNNNMTYTEAYDYVKSRRNIIEPNNGFKKQLIIYSLEILADKYSK